MMVGGGAAAGAAGVDCTALETADSGGPVTAEGKVARVREALD